MCDEQTESSMTALLMALMRAADAPPEQYERLDLPPFEPNDSFGNRPLPGSAAFMKKQEADP